MTSEELPGESYLTDNRSYLYEKYDIKPRYDDPDEEPDDATVGTRRYPPDWETRREAICNHYGWECGRCGRHVVKQDLETHVHHAKPLADGGTHELKNLILLCAPCHALLHPEADVGAFYNAPLFPARDADPRVAVEREPETTFEGYWYERQREPIPNAVPGYNEVSRSSKTTDVPAIVAVKKEKPTQEEYQAFQAGQDSPQNKPTTQSRAELTNSRARRENDDGEDEESHETYGRDQEPLSNTSQPQSTADRKQSGGKQRPHDQRKRAKEKLAEARSQRESDIASSSRSDWRRTQTMYSKPLEPGVPPPETVPDPEAADAAKERSQRKLERARRARARGEDLETAESPTPTPQPSGDADVPSDPEPRLDRESPDQGGDQTNDGAQSSASSDSSTSERLAVGLGWSVNRLVEGGLLALLTVPVLGVSIGMMR